MVNRRRFLWLGLGALAAGCGFPTVATLHGPLPSEVPQTPTEQEYEDLDSVLYPAHEEEHGFECDSHVLQRVIARQEWCRRRPNTLRLNPMTRITRITVHHEGSQTRYDTGWTPTVVALRQIQKYHTAKNGWGDIGYHFIVDRKGRVWEGRELRYQGAHTRNHNRGNIGVMLLGNFDKQKPPQAQLEAMAGLVRELRRKYGVQMWNVKTHGQWVTTGCPGKHLQSQFDHMKHDGTFR
jgi:hypothetical protein